VIPEVSFPAEQVRAGLAERPGRVDETDDSGRLWFVCRDPLPSG
jgi:hypothetical protein